ncbi:hypothetical protein L7F22_057450 [Adiantum nelumboides]|nr:hypothetical protein [Adiantum nelumboides]
MAADDIDVEVSSLFLEEEKGQKQETLCLMENEDTSGPYEQIEGLMQPRVQPNVKDELIQKMLSPDLTSHEKGVYLHMLQQFPNLFITSYEEIRVFKGEEINIPIKEGAQPVRQKLRRMGQVQLNALKEEVDKLLKAGFIYPVSTADWQVAKLDPLQWSNECEEVFQRIKEVLGSLPTMQAPTWDKEFYVNPSVGEDAIGAMLLQQGTNSHYMKPIYYASRVKLEVERDYTDVELIMASVVYACRSPTLSKRLMKFIVELQEFQFSFLVEESTRSTLADLLTYKEAPLFVKEDTLKKQHMEAPDIDNAFLLFFDGSYRKSHNEASGGVVIYDPQAWSLRHIDRSHNEEAHAAAQAMIGQLYVIRADSPLYLGRESLEKEEGFLQTGLLPTELEKSKKYAFLRRAKRYMLVGDSLYMKGADLVMRRVPWKEEIYKVLEESHEGSCGGHFASKITSHKILQEGYVWPSIQCDIHHWCKSCKECQSMASRVLRSEIRGTILAYDVFEKWDIDAIGPLPITARGKCYILTAIDYLSRWAEAKPVKQITSKDVAKFGMRLELLSDKGPGFRGELVDYLCEKLHVRCKFTTPYYPQCNGMNERFNGELIRMPTKMTQSNVKTWDLELPCALWAYRTAIKTGTGFSPFHLVFGKEALLPIEVEIPALKMMLKFEEENHDALKERLLYLQCLQLDRALALEHYEQVLKTSQAKANAKVKDKGIKKGDMVLRYNSKLDSTFQKKFQIKWQGPFLVLDRFPNGTYQLADLNGTLHKARVNGYRLKKYYARLMVVIEDKPSFEESADMVADCEEIMKTSSFTLQALFAATADHE